MVRKLLVSEGQACPVQATIAIIGEEGEEIPAEWLAPPAASATAAPSPAPAAAPAERPAAGPKGRISISPRANKLAKELGVDVEKISGTGPGGRIESSDVERAAKGPKAPQGVVPFDPIRADHSQGDPVEAGDPAFLRERRRGHDRRRGL